MPDIFLDLRRIDYRSDQNALVSAWRAYADALFITSSGATRSFSCIVDPGAPFSVLPFSFWHDCNLQWRSLGQQLTRQGSQVAEPLRWHNATCYLGETTVYLMDLKMGVQAGPFLVVAKFACQRNPDAHLETISMFGMNFLTDNLLRLVLDGMSALVGCFSTP